MGEVIGFPHRRANGSPSAPATARPQFGTILITLLPDGTHQYVREGAYASSANLSIQALSEVTADLSTRALDRE